MAGRDRGLSSPALAPPPGNPKFSSLDGIRGFAALGVLAVHGLNNTAVTAAQSNTPWVRAVFTARIVLPLFFMLSGFLLYRPFVAARVRGRPRPAKKTFWKRRALRLVPAYWVAVTLLAIWPGLPGVFGHNWWTYYGFVYVYRQSTIGGGLYPAWTLCVDVTLYLVLPFYAMGIEHLVRRMRPASAVRVELVILAGLWSVAAVWWFVLLLHVPGTSALAQVRACNLPANLDWLVFGMVFAVLSVHDRSGDGFLTRLLARRGAVAISWGAAFIGYVLLCVFIFKVTPPVEHLLAGFICAAIFAPAALVGDRGSPLMRVLDNRLIAWVALVSVGVYLYHPVVLQELYKWGVHINPSGFAAYASLVAVAVPASLFLGWLSYHLVERPFLGLKSQAGPVQPAVVTPAAGSEQTTPPNQRTP